MCKFCENFDFSRAGVKIEHFGTKTHANICFAGGSSRMPVEERFLFCPMCGKEQKNGAVLCFPCEIGDTVYLPDVDAEDAIIRYKVIKLGAGINGLFFVVDDEDQNEHPIEYFGKEVFLSEEEAAKQYDKLIDGEKKAMQFFGFNAGDKLYIPERESGNGDHMKFRFVTAIGSDEEGPFFRVNAPNARDAQYKYRDMDDFFCLTEEEARALWTSLKEQCRG